MQHIIIFLLLISFSAAQAQKSAIVSTHNYLNTYNRDKMGEADALIKAKEFIDRAVLSESTSNSAKAWYYRGNVYWAFFESKNPVHQAIVQYPLNDAIDAYYRSFELEPKGEFARECQVKLSQGAAILQNEGIRFFNEKDYASAMQLFEQSVNTAAKLGLTDTSGIVNIGVAAMAGQNYDKAIAIYNQLIAMGNLKNSNYYFNLSKAQKAKGDEQAALSTLRKARQAFPDDAALIVEELNYYLSKGQDKEAEELLRVAVQKDPNNAQLFFASGAIFDKLGKKAEAEAAYKRAIEIKADYFDAIYNLGAMFFNNGKELLDKANNEKDNKKYEAGKKLAEAEFKKAQPYLERALDLQADDVNTLTSLKQLYGITDQPEKFMEMKKRLER